MLKRRRISRHNVRLVTFMRATQDLKIANCDTPGMVAHYCTLNSPFMAVSIQK